MARTVLQRFGRRIGRGDEIDLILEDEAKSRLRPTRCGFYAHTFGARCPKATIPSATNAFSSARDPRSGLLD
jgi:hypothetical protein